MLCYFKGYAKKLLKGLPFLHLTYLIQGYTLSGLSDLETATPDHTSYIPASIIIKGVSANTQ